MKSSLTTKETAMNSYRSTLLFSVALAATALVGCSKEPPSVTAQSNPVAHSSSDSVKAATRYVDPKVGLKTTPFTLKAPAEHPAEAHTTPAH